MSIKVTAVSNGEEAYKEYLKNKPDIIMTDIEMPKMNGLELIEKIRAIDTETQIIITTAYTNTEYFLRAIELQLVKYILKPITLIELKSALTTCVKNSKTNNTIMKFNENSYYNLKTDILFMEGKEKKLDYHEKLLLKLLLKHKNQIISYEEIESTIWYDGMSSAAIRSLVRNLRQKLPSNTIENLSKSGYKIIVQNT